MGGLHPDQIWEKRTAFGRYEKGVKGSRHDTMGTGGLVLQVQSPGWSGSMFSLFTPSDNKIRGRGGRVGMSGDSAHLVSTLEGSRDPGGAG